MRETLHRVSIYVLIDPISDEIRYVGKAGDLDKRFRLHCSDLTNEKGRWIKQLFEDFGKKPIIRVLELVPIYFGNARERYYIDFFLKQGASLFNAYGVSPTSKTCLEIRADLWGLVHALAYNTESVNYRVIDAALEYYFKKVHNYSSVENLNDFVNIGKKPEE